MYNKNRFYVYYSHVNFEFQSYICSASPRGNMRSTFFVWVVSDRSLIYTDIQLIDDLIINFRYLLIIVNKSENTFT